MCNCGIVGREGNDVIAFDACGGSMRAIQKSTVPGFSERVKVQRSHRSMKVMRWTFKLKFCNAKEGKPIVLLSVPPNFLVNEFEQGSIHRVKSIFFSSSSTELSVNELEQDSLYTVKSIPFWLFIYGAVEWDQNNLCIMKPIPFW